MDNKLILEESLEPNKDPGFAVSGLLIPRSSAKSRVLS